MASYNAPSTKFDPFNTLKTTYKTVHNHPIEVYTLLPKSLSSVPSQPRPLIVKFHGGFLVTGDAMYDEWMPNWLVQYALQHNAIMVLPNHRLLPEATGMEIMDDIHDFWSWLSTDFQGYLKTESQGVVVDFGKVLVTGESAGGYLSIQSALGSSQSVGVKAAIATYPLLDVASRFYTEEYDKDVFGAPTLPKEILANHLEAVEEDAKNGNKRVVTSAMPPERIPIALSMVQQGMFLKLLGEEKMLNPFARLEDVNGADVPPILIMHGKDDSAVPVEGSEKWLEKAKERLGEEKVELVIQPGEHGFDSDPSLNLQTPWLRKSLQRITRAWLGQ